MSDRDKLIELISAAINYNVTVCDAHYGCEGCPGKGVRECAALNIADHLIANGVTVQTTPISYERLLYLARQMHIWIFLNCADEQKVYDELKIADHENLVFGYTGKFEMPLPEPPKGEQE